MPALRDVARQALDAARLAPPVRGASLAALTRHRHVFGASPVWSLLCLAWAEALADPPYEAFVRAAVACDFMAAGYDLFDRASDDALSSDEDSPERAASDALLTLAHALLERLDVPMERRVRAHAALNHADRRARAGHARDLALRRLPAAAQDDLLVVLRRRSGTLVAAPCQVAALLAGATWRVVGLATRFGRDLGCAAQLEDDLADRAEDARDGRKTIPLLLERLYPDDAEVVEATTWVLIRGFQRDAAHVLTRLPIEGCRTEALWTFLPSSLHAA